MNLLIKVGFALDECLTNQTMPKQSGIKKAETTMDETIKEILEKLFSIKGAKKSPSLLLDAILDFNQKVSKLFFICFSSVTTLPSFHFERFHKGQNQLKKASLKGHHVF